MENEKRMVGDYTVLNSMYIGHKEIILGENPKAASGERFLCCYGERNDIFEKFTECAVGDDYIDAILNGCKGRRNAEQSLPRNAGTEKSCLLHLQKRQRQKMSNMSTISAAPSISAQTNMKSCPLMTSV